MRRNSEIRKVAFLGDYLPRQCGIATFTHDLTTSVASRYPAADCFVLPVNDVASGYDYPPEVRFEIQQDQRDSYRRAADFLNLGNADVACLQHEYGIFGGPAGSYILDLLHALRMPVVTTLHTVLSEPNAEQRRVLAELTSISARVVVMTERARSFLRDRSGVPDSKIDLIAHGIPDMPFVDPSFYKDKLGVGGKLVALTFGLLSPNKGIEHMLRAMPEILGDFPTFVYIVLGATHPNLLREQGERYRQSLEKMAQDLGIAKNVIFDNRFVALGELTEFIVAADVYVTPYLNPAQSVSGTLAYSFGCGKAVVSTPYWHAEELLADHRGVLVPFADSKSLAREIRDLLVDEPRRHAMRKTAYLIGRGMVWENVARLYMETFQRARRGRTDTTLQPRESRTRSNERAGYNFPESVQAGVAGAESSTPRIGAAGASKAPPQPPSIDTSDRSGSCFRPVPELPAWRLDHLQRLTDATGIFQFADHGIPNFAEGYCTDDVARALLLTVLLEELGLDSPAVERSATTYASFLQFAFNPERNRFRNFLSFDRRWVEDMGSDDCQGRAVWALGACLGRSKRRKFQYWAAEHFEQAVTAIAAMTAPRAWAFGLLGIREYRRRLEGDRLIGQIQEDLTSRLLDLFDRSASVQWPWFEGMLAYDNARLPQALIATGGDRALATGLRALRWLVGVQKSPRGDFRPIGSNGFHRKGGEPAQFDQQPVEAQATVSACLEAYRATGDKTWLGEAHTAFAWFLGRNDLGLELYDPVTGGCCDGLLQDRVNLNQGAESTLAFLLSLAELSLLESTQST